jgi:hypothetical protein
VRNFCVPAAGLELFLCALDKVGSVKANVRTVVVLDEAETLEEQGCASGLAARDGSSGIRTAEFGLQELHRPPI